MYHKAFRFLFLKQYTKHILNKISIGDISFIETDTIYYRKFIYVFFMKMNTKFPDNYI